MRKLLVLLSATVVLAVAPTAGFAQVSVDTPIGGLRVGPRHDYHSYYGYRSPTWDDDAVVQRRVYRDRAVRLGGGCRTVTIEREDGSIKRIRRCD